MNRTYELMFIVRPDMTEEDQDKLISTLESAVASSSGNAKSGENGQTPPCVRGSRIP